MTLLIAPEILSDIPFLNPAMKSLPIWIAIPGRDFKTLAKFSPNDLANSLMLISPLVSFLNESTMALMESISF